MPTLWTIAYERPLPPALRIEQARAGYRKHVEALTQRLPGLAVIDL